MKTLLSIVITYGLLNAGIESARADAKTPLVIPKPKVVHVLRGKFQPAGEMKWQLRAESRDLRLWNEAEKVFSKGPGVYEHTNSAWVVLRLGGPALADLPTENASPLWAANPEGYHLLIQTNGLAIISRTSQGVFYGLQTLVQLEERPGGTWPMIEIEDWPSLRFRGAHWFPSATGVPMHLKLIENVFGRLKLNSSVVQCEAARWDSHPEIAASNSISKADLRKLVEACRSHYVEPIPLINTPGHAEWLFRHGNNPGLAEDPATPYAYCVNNPKSYEAIEAIFGECLQVFGSRYFHIGSDEVTMRGRFPNPECPRCREHTTTDLLLKNTERLSNWLQGSNTQCMIWGDMLLGPGEARDATHAKTVEDAAKRRAGLPRGTTIVDWHYAAGADARSIDILQRAGFPVIAATFHNPDNIYNFTQAAVSGGAEGLLQTTWMGYFPDERAMRTELRQFTAFVLAAEYTWSGRSDPPTRLGYDPQEIFLKAYRAETFRNLP